MSNYDKNVQSEINSNPNEIQLIIWMNGKSKEFSFIFDVEKNSLISLTVEKLKYMITKYIFDNNKLLKLFSISNKNNTIQHLFTKKEAELEDLDIPHLKNNDILFFSFELLSVYKSINNFNQYEFIRPIKSGGFGNIFLAKEIGTNDEYAVKEINVQNFSNQNLYNISRESLILKDMSHINIIKFHTFFTYNKNFYIVMDYARGGELSSLLSSKKRLKEDQAKVIFHQIYNAVYYMHSKNIIHRDLKPNNILFLDEEKTHVIIIDFGISGQSNGNQKESTKAGTELYLPPEILTGKEFSSSTKIDMWALGIILYQMVEGCHPFEGKDGKENNILNNIIKNKLEFNKKIRITESLKKLIEGLLEKNYRFRIDTGDVLFEKWFEDDSLTKKLTSTPSLKKVKKNKTIEENLRDSDFLNKYYSRYYEINITQKMNQLSSPKINNNYLSQTKSTSSKIKPKIFYIKNNFIDFMKKNSYKILLRKKNLKESLHIDEKEEDNYNEIENYSTSQKNRIILPPINTRNSFNKMHLLPNLKLNRINSNKNQNIFDVLKDKKFK